MSRYDHEKDMLYEAMGISKKRYVEILGRIKEEIRRLLSNDEAVTASIVLENVLNEIEDEDEKILAAYLIGRMLLTYSFGGLKL